jgi:hypothetical protein
MILELHMNTITRFAIPGIALLLTLAFGLWVSNAGKPYNGILFNIHKLIALGAVVLAIIQLTQTLKGTDSLVLIIVLLVLAGLSVIALFATGALMSMEKLSYTLTLTIHRVASVVIVLSMTPVVYLLGRQM